MLFTVTSKDIFEDNPELKAFEEFSVATSNQLKYVFLVYDYDSPLRQLPIKERKEQAVIRAGYKREKSTYRLDKNARNIINGNVPRVEKAIRAFKEIQFDEDKDLYDAYCEELNEIKEFLRKKDKKLSERNMSLKYMDKYDVYMEKKKRLQEILEIREVESDDSDSIEMSSISTLDKVNIERQNG